MWGIGSILSYKEECDIRQNNSLNTFKSHSHNKSSPWFIFWLLSELVVFVIFFYWIFVPDIGFNIIEAIRKTLEQTPYRSEALECLESSFICIQKSANGYSSIHENTFHSIQTIEDVFLWCYNVLAIYWQAGFLGNFNQNFYLNLRLMKQDASIVTDKHLSFFLYKQLGNQDTQNNLQSYNRNFFRNEAEDANIRQQLEFLQKEGNWFTFTTTEVHVTLKLLNGFSMPWALISYSFLQMPTGQIISKYNMESIRLLNIYESNKVKLVGMFGVICLVLMDTIKEFYNFFKIMWKNSKKYQSNQTNLKKPTIQSYLNNKKIRLLVKITRLFIVLIIIYQLFAHPIKGVRTAWSAQKKKLTTFPENGLLFNSLLILRLLIFLYMIFTGCQIHQELIRIHSNFLLLYHHTAYFVTHFYSFILWSFIFILCIAFQLHIMVGNSYGQLSTLPNSFIWIFQQFLGIRAIEFDNQVYLSLVITITIFIYYFFFFPLCLSMTYFNITSFLKEMDTNPYYQNKENWISQIWKAAWRRYLFFFCHNPIDVIKSNAIHVDQNKASMIIRNHIQIHVERKWEKRAFYIYLIFYILFSIAAAIILSEKKQYHYHQIMDSLILSSSMKKQFQLPIIPYMTEDENILPNRHVNFDPLIIDTTRLKNLFHITDVKRWITHIMIMRLMNQEFQQLRHTVPLCNPISIVFLVSKSKPNQNKFLLPLWPKKVTPYVMLSPDKIFSHKKKLQSIYQFSRSLVKIRGTTNNPFFHHLFLSYGDITTLIDQFNEALSKFNLINGALRIIQIQWAEYNINSGNIISYILQMNLHTSGIITSKLHTSVFQGKPSSDITIGFSRLSIQYFCDTSFYFMLLSWIMFFLYYACMLYSWITRHLIYTRLQKMLDILQCLVGIYFLLCLSGAMSPSLSMPLNKQDNFQQYNPNQAHFQIFSFYHIADESRTIHILSQIKNLIRFKTFLHYAITLTIIIGVSRLVTMLTSLKKNFIYNFLLPLQYVSVTGFLCWGHLAFFFSTLSSAIKAVCFFSIFKGHIMLTAYNEPIINLPLQIWLFIIIFLNYFIGYNLVICIIYNGSRNQLTQKKTITDKPKETNLYTTKLQNVMLTCNDQVITLCQTIISLIKTPLPNQNEPEDSNVNETITKVFILLQNNNIMSYAPENSYESINRNLYIERINNIQLLFTYIMVLQCKMKLISIDTFRLKEKTQKIKSRQKTNQVYISILNTKIKRLQKEIQSYQDFKRLQKSEFLPDIIHVKKGLIVEKAHVIDPDDLKKAQSRLKRERKYLKERKHKK